MLRKSQPLKIPKKKKINKANNSNWIENKITGLTKLNHNINRNLEREVGGLSEVFLQLISKQPLKPKHN